MRFNLYNLFAVMLALSAGSGAPAAIAATEQQPALMPAGGLAMHGAPALPADFRRFPYADKAAKQGGTITYGVVGTFDGLNPFVIRGFRTTARGLFADTQFGSMVFESLMQRSQDEAFTLYPLLAQSYSLNSERSIMRFTLNPAERFADGRPVSADDILFSYQLLKEEGRPPFNSYMKQIARLEKLSPASVQFTFKAPINRELPLIIASSMPILPRHALTQARFAENNLTPILGSGPYSIDTIEAGQMIRYKRNPSYWGKDLPVNRGLNNFDTVRIRYFRNENALFEAFKKGDIDVFVENNANRWRNGYNFPAVKRGEMIKAAFAKGTPPNMMGFVFNTRRPVFADKNVRAALAAIFDFDWINRNFYGNIYQRTIGFWDGTVLSAVGRPATARERLLLAPYPALVSAEIMAGQPPLPLAAGGRQRAEAAWRLLQQTGFSRKDNQAYSPDGRLFRFEIMCQTLEEEKLALAYQHFLRRLGISVLVRTVDDTQYQNRLSNFDYDMIIGKLSASLSPGNEQLNRWGSASRQIEGSFNYAGAAEPALDAIITAMTAARSEEDFVSSVRALDRVLMAQHYYVPLYHLPQQWVAFKADLRHPAKTPLYGFRLPAWWRQ